MTRQVLSLSLVSLLSIALAGCALVASPVVNALVYTSVKGPVDVGAETNTARQGRACASNYVGIVATGDASIATAKRNGSIKSISTVDHDSLNVLGLYSRFCTIVAGE